MTHEAEASDLQPGAANECGNRFGTLVSTVSATTCRGLQLPARCRSLKIRQVEIRQRCSVPVTFPLADCLLARVEGIVTRSG
jgi:hypothetical protein